MTTILLAVMTIAAAHGQPAVECDALQRGLTAEQKLKFRLVQQECRAEPSHETASPVMPWFEAGQLQLYGASTDAIATGPLTGPAEATSRRENFTKTASRLPPRKLAVQVDAAAQRHDIDPLLLHAIAHVESRHNANAVSKAGALGVLQVMPATARRFGVKDGAALHDVRTNLDVGAKYLKVLQRRFGNDLPLILAAYNAGEGAVERYGRRIPPFNETRQYVRDVLAHYDALLAAAVGPRAAPERPVR